LLIIYSLYCHYSLCVLPSIDRLHVRLRTLTYQVGRSNTYVQNTILKKEIVKRFRVTFIQKQKQVGLFMKWRYSRWVSYASPTGMKKINAFMFNLLYYNSLCTLRKSNFEIKRTKERKQFLLFENSIFHLVNGRNFMKNTRRLIL
jgi:hypothetical protein